jgi:hypothetical protein
MLLFNQLGVTEDQLGKALEGEGKSVLEKLRKKFLGAFEFCGYGQACCLTVLKTDGVGQWLDTAQSVPTKDSVQTFMEATNHSYHRFHRSFG